MSARTRLKSSGLWTLVILAALALLPTRAGAQPWLKLDRVDVEPSYVEGLARVRVLVTAVDLYGAMLPVPGDAAFTLQAGAARKRIPHITGTWAGAGDELAVALIIETAQEYAEAMPAIRSAAHQFLQKLPSGTQVTVIGYGEEVHGGRNLVAPTAALRLLDELWADDLPGEPALIRAIDRARQTLEKASPSVKGAPMRKMIVVLSDGRDIDPFPETYREAGERADRSGIRIHSLAFSPIDDRRPLLGLGELSRRSHGTFRWIRTVDAIPQQFDGVAREIEGQLVLVYYLPAGEVSNRRIKLHYEDMVSNEVRASRELCGGETCSDRQFCAAHRCVARASGGGKGVFGWLITIIVVGVVAIIVLGLIGFVLTRRQDRRAAAEALAQAAAQAAAVDPHRIVPQGPQGGSVQPVATGHPAAPAPRPSAVGPIAPAGAAPVAPGGTPAPAARSVPTLLVLQGPMTGRRIPLRHGFTIGKAPGCDLILDDQFTSSKHAQILMDTAGGCTLVDAGSTNGTFVNGVRATQTRLAHGMSIRVGATEMRFLAQ